MILNNIKKNGLNYMKKNVFLGMTLLSSLSLSAADKFVSFQQGDQSGEHGAQHHTADVFRRFCHTDNPSFL